MAGRIYFAGIYMTKGVPNLERGFDRPKLGTPFSFLRCFPFCGRVLRTAPLDSPSVHMGTRIFYLAKCRYEHPYQAESGRKLRSGLGFFFCPFARAYSVQLSFHLDQRQAAAPQS